MAVESTPACFMSRVLVAGCGYVGTVLARELAGAGHEVWGLRRSRASGTDGVRMISADVADPGSFRQIPARVETMVYLVAPAAREPDAYRDCYLKGLKNLLSVCTSDHALLVTSTTVFGQNSGEWVDEETEPRPADYRGEIMLEAEALLGSTGNRATVVRFGGIYGPGRDRLVRQVREGRARCSEPPRYTNRIHRDDCAGLLSWLVRNEPEHGLYLGVDDEPASDCEVLDWIAGQLGLLAPPRVRNEAGANKRIRNARARASGYDFRYPDYRAGYVGLIGTS